MADRNFGAEIGIATEEAKEWFTKAIHAYKVAFGLTVLLAVILVMIGTVLNRTAAVFNFSLAAVFVAIWGYLTFHPAGLLAVFGIGGLNGLPKDWSVNRLIREGTLPDLSLSAVAQEGFSLVRKWAQLSSHVAYFAIVVLTVLGTWYVKNVAAVLPVLVLLAGIGFWAVLSKAAAKWYYRITFGILAVSLGTFLYVGFWADESGNESTSWRAVQIPGVVATIKGWIGLNTYEKTVDVSIADLTDKKVCGLPADAKLVFRPVNPVVVYYGRPNDRFMPIDITSAMRVRGVGSPNDTTPGEAFTTDPQGCVVVTLDIRQSFRKEAVLDRVDEVMAKHPRGVQLRFKRW